MSNEHKTQAQLIAEVERLRERVSELEKAYPTVAEFGNSDTKSCTLLERSPVCSKIIDLQSRLRYMSSAGVNRLKIPDVTRFYGCTFPLDFYPEKTRILLTDHLELAKTGEVSTVEYPMFDLEGQEVWFSTTFLPAYDEAGKIEYIIVTSVDIIDRKRMETELLKIQNLESVGNLAGKIAHDFHNLLTVIIGNISLAKMTPQLGEEPLTILTRAENAGNQAQNLIQQLLAFSTDEQPVKTAIPTAQLLRDTVDFALSGSKTTADFKLPDDIRPIDADYGQIGQVVQNLIINADQAMPNGGIVSIQAENASVSRKDALPLNGRDYVKITITDHGIGIPLENQKKIFDPFFTTKQKGTGLGLATAHSIIHNHNGYIALESTLGAGTTFCVYLPVSQKDIEISTDDFVQVQKMRTILVMDDDEFIRKYAAHILQLGGHQVKFAKDGAEVLEIYGTAQSDGESIDVVILDLTIRGGKGGEETIRELIAMDPKVKAIVSSGYANNPVLTNYREYGFKGVIPKPFKPAEMLAIVAKTIREEI